MCHTDGIVFSIFNRQVFPSRFCGLILIYGAVKRDRVQSLIGIM